MCRRNGNVNTTVMSPAPGITFAAVDSLNAWFDRTIAFVSHHTRSRHLLLDAHARTQTRALSRTLAARPNLPGSTFLVSFRDEPTGGSDGTCSNFSSFFLLAHYCWRRRTPISQPHWREQPLFCFKVRSKREHRTSLKHKEHLRRVSELAQQNGTATTEKW